MRGAALKIGQLLSIQDENVLPPQVCEKEGTPTCGQHLHLWSVPRSLEMLSENC